MSEEKIAHHRKQHDPEHDGAAQAGDVARCIRQPRWSDWNGQICRFAEREQERAIEPQGLAFDDFLRDQPEGEQQRRQGQDSDEQPGVRAPGSRDGLHHEAWLRPADPTPSFSG
jgi:hypothetical protein